MNFHIFLQTCSDLLKIYMATPNVDDFGECIDWFTSRWSHEKGDLFARLWLRACVHSFACLPSLSQFFFSHESGFQCINNPKYELIEALTKALLDHLLKETI